MMHYNVVWWRTATQTIKITSEHPLYYSAEIRKKKNPVDALMHARIHRDTRFKKKKCFRGEQYPKLRNDLHANTNHKKLKHPLSITERINDRTQKNFTIRHYSHIS